MSLGGLARYDTIHVVSDLHMGGAPGFQILRETARLANFIRRVAKASAETDVALVLNGDIFDTLAEDTGGYVAIEQAAETVRRIMDDASFKDIWDALAAFVQTARRTLVIVIGNHDIEVAFPPVQRLIVERLAGGNPAARGRIEFSTMGAGYACLVGDARVYCVHGNEVDAWNYNRYEELARVARRLNADQRFDPADWHPNAGTRMVKDVMNKVKRRYAWIDLLKPENSAAVGTLMVIDPSQLNSLRELAGVVGERTRGGFEFEGRLSVEPVAASAQPPAPPPLEQLLGPNLRAAAVVRPAATDMLLAAEDNLAAPSAASAPDGTLGTGQLIFDRLTGWLRGVDRAEALRRALLDWLRGDSSFNFGDRDDTFKDVMKNVGPSVDIVVTGHTHLARAIDLGGGRLYFNSGTWIRLMQFTEAMLKDKASFAAIFDVLENGSMARLDAARYGDKSLPLLLDRTSAIEITRDANGKVVGKLNRVIGDGTGDPTAEVTLSMQAGR